MMSQKMGELIMSSRESTSLQFQLMIMDSVIPTYSINEALVQEMQNEGQKAGCPIQRTLHQQAHHTQPHWSSTTCSYSAGHAYRWHEQMQAISQLLML